LLDYATVAANEHPTMTENCYAFLFYKWTSLTTAPALPAETLANSCYRSMFSGCTSLTTAPALPAETLEDHCYNAMFSDCTSLATVPTLPAKTMAKDCYKGMFMNCSKIKMSTSYDATNYPNEYSIPQAGSGGTTASNWNTSMFSGTGGTFTGDPVINTTYYTSNTIVPVTP
jgi:hypothetical protein